MRRGRWSQMSRFFSRKGRRPKRPWREMPIGSLRSYGSLQDPMGSMVDVGRKLHGFCGGPLRLLHLETHEKCFYSFCWSHMISKQWNPCKFTFRDRLYWNKVKRIFIRLVGLGDTQQVNCNGLQSKVRPILVCSEILAIRTCVYIAITKNANPVRERERESERVVESGWEQVVFHMPLHLK